MKIRVFLASLIFAISCSTAAYAQVEKPRLAIQEIVAQPEMMSKLSAAEKSVLREILEGIDPLLMIAIVDNKKFDVVARSDYDSIVREQKIQNSGDVDPSDSQIAKMFNMAGVKYVAVLKIVSFEEHNERETFSGEAYEKRKIEARVTLQIFDTTSAIVQPGVTFRVVEDAQAKVNSRGSGRATNTIIDTMKDKIATTAANQITGKLITPKVLDYTNGVILFTRGEGSEVAVGQYWEIFSQGPDMIMDGINYGAKQITVGWCKVDEVYEQGYSRAVAIVDNGIDRGNRVRLHSGDGPPEGIDLEARPKGSGANSSQQTNRQNSSTSTSTSSSENGEANMEPVTLAVFVKNVSDLDDHNTTVFEEYLKAQLVSRNISIISRAEVMNAVSAYSKSGANRGTGNLDNIFPEWLLSDRSSAQQLAQYMGADGFIVASITSIDTETQKTHGGLEKVTHSLDIAWNVLDGETGGSLAGGLSRAEKVTASGSFNEDGLLRDNATQIGKSVKAAVADNMDRRPSAANDADSAFIKVALLSLYVPQVVKQEDGTYRVVPSEIQLEPQCNVLINGIHVGSAPGRVSIPSGRHRVIIEDTASIVGVDRYISVKTGAELTISVELSEDAKRRWNELSKEAMREWEGQLRFLDELEANRLRFLDELEANKSAREQELIELQGELEQKLVKTNALVEFMKDSSIKIDTSDLETADFTLNTTSMTTPGQMMNNVWLRLFND